MDQFSCPSCFKDYEVCRRFMMSEEDLEYSKTPKVLKCMHTCCYSCLESMIQKNPNGNLICPLCKEISLTKGVRYLPFDGCAMLEALHTDATLAMKTCDRCRDEVEAFSWCLSCSAALCEFHHNDHKRSLDTSHHSLVTVEEIDSRRVKITPHLPPMPCPDIPGELCTMFCRTCRHPVSLQAMMSYHKAHDVEEVNACRPGCVEDLGDVLGNLTDMQGALSDAIGNVKGSMRKLDSVVNATATSIVEEFERCRAALAERENILLKRLESVANEKRLLLTNQLNEISDLYEDCNVCSQFGNSVMSELTEEQRGMYLVAAAPVVKERYDSLNSRVEKLILEPVANPSISASFNSVELEVYASLVNSLGAVHIQDFNDLRSLYEAADHPESRPQRKTGLPGPTGAKETALTVSDSKDLVGTLLDSKPEDKMAGSREGVATESKDSPSLADLDVRAQFSVTMSPHLCVENVQKKEIRDIRSSVVEIRACTPSHGVKKLSEKPKLKMGNVDRFAVESKLSDVPPLPPLGGSLLSPMSSSVSGLAADEEDEEEYNEQLQLRETGRQIQLLRQKREVAALASTNEDEVNEMFGGNIIGRVVVVNETLQSILGRHELRTLIESLAYEDGLPVLRITTELLKK